MPALWRFSPHPQEPLDAVKVPSSLGRAPSATSVLEAWGSGSLGSEAGSPAQSPHGPQAPPLLDAVLSTVCAAARDGQALPQRTAQLLQQLFPSATSISATVPSFDGLGMAVVTLVQLQQQHPDEQELVGAQPPPAEGAAHPAAQQRLAQPLPAGGVLSFGLALQPPPAEQQLMQAFASELSSRLEGPCKVPALEFPLPQGSGPLPHDCFWMPY